MVTELLRHGTGVTREHLRDVAVLPATLVLQCLRQIPVLQGREELNAGGLQFVHQLAVEIQALSIRRASAFWEHARPGHAEVVGVRADILHQRDIVLVAVVMVVRDITGVAILDLTGSMRVGVPDGRSFAVFVPGPLDLVGRRASAPVKIVRNLRAASGDALDRTAVVCADAFRRDTTITYTNNDVAPIVERFCLEVTRRTGLHVPPMAGNRE